MSLHISFNAFAWIVLVLLGLAAVRFIASAAYPSLRRKSDEDAAGGFADDAKDPAEDPEDDYDQARTCAGTFRPPWWTEADDEQFAALLGLGPDGRPL